MPKTCPSCGFNLVAVEPTAAVGPLSVSLYGDCWWNGARVRLTKGELAVVHILASNPGVWMSREAIGAQASDSENPNLIDVHMARIRKKFKAVDPSFDRLPLTGSTGRGYRWECG